MHIFVFSSESFGFASADDAIYFTALPRGGLLRLRYMQEISEVAHLLRNRMYYKLHGRKAVYARQNILRFTQGGNYLGRNLIRGLAT